MRVVFLLSLVALAVATPSMVEPEVGFNYHEKVGIPLATSIKEAEEKHFAKQDAMEFEGVKIVGGSITPTNAHPYLAGLLINFINLAGQSACGSSLISANRLVTAAHCWFDGVNQGSQITVILGSQFLFFGGTRIVTNTVVMHQQWNPALLHNDIAVIYLPSNVAFSASIQPIALPAFNELNDQFVGEWAMAAGYGFTSDAQTGLDIDTTVRHVSLQVITAAQCTAIYGVHAIQSTICTNGAGGVGICRGDSGGPLLVYRNGRPILIGVSSFAARNACQHGHPSGFARVTSFYNFIAQNM